jgi:hypothetical protein
MVVEGKKARGGLKPVLVEGGNSSVHIVQLAGFP